ncbi:MAG: hypothetical protein ACI835_005307 [Planctomycetota bacterium]|jgi:hypothetical protein
MHGRVELFAPSLLFKLSRSDVQDRAGAIDLFSDSSGFRVDDGGSGTIMSRNDEAGANTPW